MDGIPKRQVCMLCVPAYEARGDQGIQKVAPGKTGCPKPATGGSYNTQGRVLIPSLCVHVGRSVSQQLLGGCVPRDLHAPVPPNVQMEGPGPATEQSMYLRPGTEDSDSIHVFIIFH